MPELLSEIREEVDKRAEEVRKQVNVLVHRRRFLRNYIKALEPPDDAPHNYATVVLAEYQQELDLSEAQVVEARALLAAWRKAQKKLKEQEE